MFKNDLAGLVSLVKLAWRPGHNIYWKKTFLPFSNDFLSCLSENTVQCPKMYFYVFLNIHSSNCMFLPFCSIDWFRFQKPLAIGPIRIPRYQDFWDESLGWFLGFRYRWLQNSQFGDYSSPREKEGFIQW